MIIKTCDKCGAEIHYFTETNVKFPKYYIRKYVSEFGLQFIDVDLCADCEEKLAKWLSADDEEKYDEWLKEKTCEDIQNKIATLEAKNEHLRNILKMNESFADATALTVKNDMEHQEEQKHWFRNSIKKVFGEKVI